MIISSNLSEVTADCHGIAGAFASGKSSYMMTFTGHSYPNDSTTHLNYTLSNLQTREVDIVLDNNHCVVEVHKVKLLPDEAAALRNEGIQVPQYWVSL